MSVYSRLGMKHCACSRVLLIDDAPKEAHGMRHMPSDHCITLTVRNPMEFTTYVRKPFTVQAVEITAENIAEVAKLVGDLKERDDHTPYILVDPRLVPNVERVYIGYFMTKMGENVRCYSRRIFTSQFVVQDAHMEQWLAYLEQGDEADVPA